MRYLAKRQLYFSNCKKRIHISDTKTRKQRMFRETSSVYFENQSELTETTWDGSSKLISIKGKNKVLPVLN
jgi:hypothetical protein